MHRDLAREVHEVLVLRDEVRLAVHLDEGPDLPVEVDVMPDHALGRLPLATLGRLGLPALAQQIDRLLGVTIGLLERLLALHHPRSGAVAESLHVGSADAHCLVSPSAGAGAGGAGGVAAAGCGGGGRLVASGRLLLVGGGLRLGGSSRGRGLLAGLFVGAGLLLGLALRALLGLGAGLLLGLAAQRLLLSQEPGAGPRRPRRRSCGSRARSTGSRRRCPGSRSRPTRGCSWCRPARSWGCAGARPPCTPISSTFRSVTNTASGSRSMLRTP